MSEDFDRSFEFFQSKVDGEEAKIQKIWKNDNSWINKDTSLDTSFEDNMFEFLATKVSPARTVQSNGTSTSNHVLFPADPFVKGQQDTDTQRLPIQLAVSEQVSAMYDDFSQEGAISVTGTIRMKTIDMMDSTICLVLKDYSTNVLRFDHMMSSCEDISESAHDNGVFPSDRVFRMKLVPPVEKENEYMIIANYTCIAKVRPVPLLIKSRVRSSADFARVGFKIRANPTNVASMKNMTIIMAVPPDVDGETVKTSMKGGSWEELKRTLCWSVDQLEPGKALEIQAQFALLDGGGTNRVPKFPVLVRCDYPLPFSTLTLSGEYHDDQSVPIKINVSASSRILHRKV